MCLPLRRWRCRVWVLAAGGVLGWHVAGFAQSARPADQADPPTTVWSNNPLPCPRGEGVSGQAQGVSNDRNVYIALGTDGTLYFTANVCVFRIDAAGTVTRVAGGGEPTKKGEVTTGKATKAYLPGLNGIAVDSRGSVFVAAGSGRIVEITPEGQAQPFYEDKQGGIHALTIDDQDNLYYLDVGGGVVKLTVDGQTVQVTNGSSGFAGDGGPAKQGAFSAPTALAVDEEGDIYIADTGNNRVRMVTPDGMLSTVAGMDLGDDPVSTVDGLPPLSTRLPGPDSAAVDGSGDLLIGESALARIRRVSWSGGTVSSLFTYGGANYWGLFEKAADAPPTFHVLAAGKDGFLYAVDDAHCQIIKISAYGDMDVVVRTQTTR